MGATQSSLLESSEREQQKSYKGILGSYQLVGFPSDNHLCPGQGTFVDLLLRCAFITFAALGSTSCCSGPWILHLLWCLQAAGEIATHATSLAEHHASLWGANGDSRPADSQFAHRWSPGVWLCSFRAAAHSLGCSGRCGCVPSK